ncbi:MAG: DEAD/DEAH box helicase family protein [Verrucomicrobia bacterium]|nr:DEAD/DEAH box helicase family protein [Verrucomicrobiota bacterium]
MNEAETRAELIDPALKAAGWGVTPESRVGREVIISPGRIQGAGRRASSDIADYVLTYRGQKLAVVEAKKRDLPVTEGLAQAKKYCERLQARFAYSTNGVGIYRADMHTGNEGEVANYPTPDELWTETFAEANQWRDRFAAIPFEDKGGNWEARYYQHNAINKTLEAIAAGEDRILLTLATGTGKTFIAFQLAWKLFESKWNLSREPGRRPRILFLADRNILADQAFNSFSAFEEDALVRIAPDEISKKGRVPKNGSIFFTIFQTFMSGRDEEGESEPYFGEYPPDFFDFIVIDECHRGGAKDESSWRGILDYFSPAVQLGLTATPKREHNADTYDYFGKPVYVYSLKEGINDGFLTPFRVNQISTTLDDYVYVDDDEIEDGEVETGKRYEEKDFNVIIEIKEREAKRVQIFMDSIDQREKTIVFCSTQVHALAVRDLINQYASSTEPNYCVRVTANDGKLGEQQLRVFQDNEKTIPTILTTSRKLSTGVDARNVRHIVLMRPVKSMIEFKQIIGRGTRTFDGKDYFTIHDFVKAYEHFNDEEWDGEPLEPAEPKPREEKDDDIVSEPPPEREYGKKKQIVKITLADGKERQIQHMSQTTFWHADGHPISAAEFVQNLFGDLPAFFHDEKQLREIWSQPDTRKSLMEGLSEKGYSIEQLEEAKKIIGAEKSDVFDVLAYIAFSLATQTREERVTENKDLIFSHYEDKQQAFLDFVLTQYVKEGVSELQPEKLKNILELKYGGIHDAIRELGDAAEIGRLFVEFQKYLYEKSKVA